MAEFICNTSPLQYLHQIGKLDLIPRLIGRVMIPPAVAEELAEGRTRGYNVPDARNLSWIEVRKPTSAAALPLARDLGAGEAGVLALALEQSDAVIIMDDEVGRKVARLLRLRMIGTLGLLLEAKRKGLITAVTPCLDEFARLGFRVSLVTRQAVQKLAGESSETSDRK